MGARKHKCESPEVLETLAQAYFRICMRSGGKPPTLPGLASALGFSSKKAMKRWIADKGTEWTDVYERQVNEVESWLVERASGVDTKNSRGIEFILSNEFGYANQQVIQIQGAFNQLIDKTVEVLAKYVLDDKIEEALGAYRQVVSEVCEY